jgi:Mn2+/Fe2+ NRAMP family transporter
MTTSAAVREVVSPTPLSCSPSLTRTLFRRGFFQQFGPGLVTGASDDDPSGIATYSQVGAQFADGLLRTMLLSYPRMEAIQLRFLHINPVKALYWAAILNGLVASPLTYVIMMRTFNRKVMGQFVIPAYLRWVGCTATAVMVCVCIGVRFTWKA